MYVNGNMYNSVIIHNAWAFYKIMVDLDKLLKKINKLKRKLERHCLYFQDVL